MMSSTTALRSITTTVRWEPCGGFHDEAADPGVCAGCGWPADEHPVDGPAPAAEVPAAA
jgi:hypothetical protein